MKLWVHRGVEIDKTLAGRTSILDSILEQLQFRFRCFCCPSVPRL